jgi:hypothetical protein
MNLLMTWVGVLPFILLPLIVSAGIIDLYMILKALWRSSIGKFLYAFFGFYAYAISEIRAKQIVYSIVNTNPDSYTSSINILTSFYLIPSWMLIVIVIVYILILIQTPILFIFDVFNKTLSKKVDDLLNKKTIFANKGHMIMSLTFGGTMVILLAMNIEKYTAIKDQDILKKIILLTSYYPNNGTCKNIDPWQYIKFISAGYVSETNYSAIDIFDSDKKLTFKTVPCKYSIE